MPRNINKWFRVLIDQGDNGLELELYAHPRVEQFFKILAGTTKPVNIEGCGGKLWFSPEGKQLQIYNFPQVRDIRDAPYTYFYPGYGFNNTDLGLADYSTNLSFLRLIGISEPGGVKLGIKSVMSFPAREELKESLIMSVRKFIRENLSKTKLELIITQREIEG